MLSKAFGKALVSASSRLVGREGKSLPGMGIPARGLQPWLHVRST